MSLPTPPPPHLDHIILLLPYSQLLSLPSFLTQNFTITPGGRHFDDKTENRLICFADGSYIELIAFIDDLPENRAEHGWGKKLPGVIDFAFTHAKEGTNEALKRYGELEGRLGKLDEKVGAEQKVRYRRPVEGGRKRTDGVELEWVITVVDSGDESAYQRGELPFFCHDVTSRELRVPFSKDSTTHPSGSQGVSELSVLVPQGKVETHLKAYSAILGVPYNISKEKPLEGWLEIEKFRGDGTTWLVVKAPKEEWQSKALEERGGYLLGGLDLGPRSEREKRRLDGEADEFDVGGIWI